ncbi:TniQ family protein [Methylomagnum sp.]
MSERSGVPEATLRTLALAGWVPWLFDRLEPGAGDFGRYVARDVLLPAGVRPPRDPPGWRPWLAPGGFDRERACRRCLAEAAVPLRRLAWRLPLLRTCPLHGVWLEPAMVRPGQAVAWHTAETPPPPVPEDLRVLDLRSGQALEEGAVDLPGRRVHAGVWFRLLRTLLDELSTPLYRLRGQRAPLLDLWRSLALPPRAGAGPWKPFEALADARQDALLRAAARALALVEAGEMKALGGAADLFRREPAGPDWPPGGTPIPADPTRKRWTDALAACQLAIDEARADPGTARNLRALLLFGRTDQATVARVDGLLAELGIPLPPPVL